MATLKLHRFGHNDTDTLMLLGNEYGKGIWLTIPGGAEMALRLQALFNGTIKKDPVADAMLWHATLRGDRLMCTHVKLQKEPKEGFYADLTFGRGVPHLDFKIDVSTAVLLALQSKSPIFMNDELFEQRSIEIEGDWETELTFEEFVEESLDFGLFRGFA